MLCQGGISNFQFFTFLFTCWHFKKSYDYYCKLSFPLKVGVHIADVSHFIRPGNALDKEAALRATTVYLVDKRIDMVPGKMSAVSFKNSSL